MDLCPHKQGGILRGFWVIFGPIFCMFFRQVFRCNYLQNKDIIICDFRFPISDCRFRDEESDCGGELLKWVSGTFV